MLTARSLRTFVPAAAVLAVTFFVHTASAQTKVAVANP